MKEDIYLQNSYNGIVYKKLPTHYLQLSPWDNDQDRRVSIIDYVNCQVLTFQNACMIINKQFDETKESWEKNGKQYVASPINENENIDEYAAFLSMLPSHDIKIQTENLLNNLNGDSISIENKNGYGELKLVRHKGKPYYILIVNETYKLGRAKAYNMFGKFCQWVGIKHVKPIFCLTDKKYV